MKTSRTTHLRQPAFWIGPAAPRAVIPLATPFAIVVDEYPVVYEQPNGQAKYLSYRTERGAQPMLQRVRMVLPTAELRRVHG